MSTFRADLARFAHPSLPHRESRPTRKEIARVLLLERATWAVGEYRARQWADRQGGAVAKAGKVIGFFTKHVAEILTGIYLPTTAKFGPGLVIAHFGPIIVHGDTVAGEDFSIHAQTTIGTHNGGVPRFGDRVFVGPGARVLGGITVGDEAMIGANTVVMRDVPPGHVVTGGPVSIRERRGEHWLTGAQD